MEISGSAQGMAVPGAGPGQRGEGQGPQPQPRGSEPPGPASSSLTTAPRHQAWLQERNQPSPVQMPLSLFFSYNYVSEG